MLETDDMQQLLRLFSISGGGSGGPQTPMNMGEDGFGFHSFVAENFLDFQILQRLSFVCCSSWVRY
ncbi:BnaA07g35960D [Brassica napus]|uniref:BnaA07g35960D protein n=1 Tax=Brassica napus TaxID=3708 RepID=A0A078J9L0_BRANA|nr:BnaA07g35960D [Brassica napus]